MEGNAACGCTYRWSDAAISGEQSAESCGCVSMLTQIHICCLARTERQLFCASSSLNHCTCAPVGTPLSADPHFIFPRTLPPTMPLTLLHTLSGHTDRVWCAAWSPNGKALATCGGDKAIRLWVEQTNPDTGKAEFVCKQVIDGTHSRTIRCVSWSPNGRALASAGFDGITAIWERDASSGDFECIATLEGHENEVKWVSWARSGTMLATCSRDKSVWIWAAEGGAANVDAGGEKEFECLSVLNGHTQDVKVAKWHPTIDVSKHDKSDHICTSESALISFERARLFAL